jgi:predicted transcriptional regulator
VTRFDAKTTQNDIALNEWQIEDMSKGVAEAERGGFASDEEVEHG